MQIKDFIKGVARLFRRSPNFLEQFDRDELPQCKAKLEELQNLPEKYYEGIFEVEKSGNKGDFSTYITKRTQGIVERIQDGSQIYSSNALMVKDKSKPISRLYIRVNDLENGKVDFPRIFSNPEKDALFNHRISYKEVYSCHDEGGLGLLQGWDYTLEILDGTHKGLKFNEDITV